MISTRSFRAFLLLPALAAGLLRAEEAPELYSGQGGRLIFVAGDSALFSLAPSVANASWEFAGAHAPKQSEPRPAAPFLFEIESGGKRLAGEFAATVQGDAVKASWHFTAKDAVSFETLVLAGEFPLPQLVGGQWTTDAASGTFPARFTRPQLFIGKTSSLALALPGEKSITFTFPQPTFVVLQDDRQWGGSTFTLRIGRARGQMTPGETWSLPMTITAPGGLGYSRDVPDFMKPVTLQADKDWVPLKVDSLDIVPGSALDLSSLGFTRGPVRERIGAMPTGHFCGFPFRTEDGRGSDNPEPVEVKQRRFYGINLCFDSSYLTKDEADRLLDRLVRLGYNAVRIHHYEAQLTSPKWVPGAAWDPAQVDKLDYLMAGCAKRGLYITTDLFVSRPISGQQIGLPQYDAPPDNRIPGDEYKILVLVSDAAFQDWCAFAKRFLDRVNPYTGLRVADDPTLAWISLINEGGVANYWGAARKMPEWKVAWNKWLAARFSDRSQLAAAIGDLAGDEDPRQGTVRLPDYLQSSTTRGRLAEVFAAAAEKAAFERMRDFLRNEIKCPALLTNMNDTGPEAVPLQGVRDAFDYVDEHFYVDHPRFLEKPWSLPSFCSNANPVAAGAAGGTAVATVRLYGKPFTLTEFDYAGPSRYRAVGGPLTGALAALQDWDALWRFDYGSNQTSLFTPAPMHYFDGVSDPLNQAADRIGLLLFLRGDVSAAPSRIAMAISPNALGAPTAAMSLTPLQAAVWRTQVGGLVGTGMPSLVVPVEPTPGAETVSTALDQLGLTPGGEGAPIRSETGEITIARADGVLTIDTPRNAGGFATTGKVIDAAKAGVRIDNVTTGATVFVSSLDSAPIKSAKRLLVTHLTDLQNTGARFGERARQTIEAWGGLPYLVLDGAATIHLMLDDPSAYTVWALATDGTRREKIDTKIDAGQLVFTAKVRGPDGARMLYEINR